MIDLYTQTEPYPHGDLDSDLYARLVRLPPLPDRNAYNNDNYFEAEMLVTSYRAKTVISHRIGVYGSKGEYALLDKDDDAETLKLQIVQMDDNEIYLVTSGLFQTAKVNLYVISTNKPAFMYPIWHDEFKELTGKEIGNYRPNWYNREISSAPVLKNSWKDEASVLGTHSFYVIQKNLCFVNISVQSGDFSNAGYTVIGSGLPKPITFNNSWYNCLNVGLVGIDASNNRVAVTGWVDNNGNLAVARPVNVTPVQILGSFSYPIITDY